MIGKTVSSGAVGFQAVLPINRVSYDHLSRNPSAGAYSLSRPSMPSSLVAPRSLRRMPFVSPQGGAAKGAMTSVLGLRAHGATPEDVRNPPSDKVLLSDAKFNPSPAGDNSKDSSLMQHRNLARQARLMGGVPMKGIPASVSDCFQQPLSWVTRPDIVEMTQKIKRPHEERAQNNAQVNLSDGTLFTANGDKIIELFSVASPAGSEKPTAILNSHSLFFVAQRGVTLQQVMESVTECSGALGGKILSDLLAISNQSSVSIGSVSSPLAQPILLDLRVWEQSFDEAVLRQLDVDTLVSQVLEEAGDSSRDILSDKRIFEKSFEKINAKFQTWAQNSWVQRSSWLTPKLNRSIYNSVLQAVCARRFHESVPGWLPGQSQAQGLTQTLRDFSDNAEVTAVADAIDKGWIALQVLEGKAFLAATYDTLGNVPQWPHQGIALGPQVYIYCKYPAEEGGIDLRDHQSLSMIVHEGGHALDWLKNPASFENYKKGIVDDIYHLERHAYCVQRQYLKEAQAKLPPTPEGPVQFPMAQLSLQGLRKEIVGMYGLANAKPAVGLPTHQSQRNYQLNANQDYPAPSG